MNDELQSTIIFDIYERVHIPDDLPLLAKIKRHALIPEIQYYQVGDEYHLKGSLNLSLYYTGIDSIMNERTQTFYHQIPLEITIPISRGVPEFWQIGTVNVEHLGNNIINVTGTFEVDLYTEEESVKIDNINKFKCTNEECIELQLKQSEDMRLILNIEDGIRHQYYLNEDGSLEHYDSDGMGQEIYLRCNVCGQKYEFDSDIGHVFEQHILPLNKCEIRDIGIIKISR
jgi:hypothetical protein